MAKNDKARKSKLDLQIEQIVDEGRGRSREVIVQMRSDEDRDGVEEIARATARTIEARLMSTTPRALLPGRAATRRPKAKSGKLTQTQRRKLRENDSSFAAQIALASIKHVAKVALNQGGMSALVPLVDSDFVTNAIVKSLSYGKSEKDAASIQPEMTHLWAAKSAVMELTIDHLRKLHEEVPNIRNIYPNRAVPLPRVSEHEDGPEELTDNYGSTWGIEKMGALSTWSAFGSKGEGALVGLLDTGVDATHPDLAGKIAHWAEFKSNGRQDPDSVEPRDSDEHGTHCAGTIVGGDASGRHIGVAPGAQLAAALVLDGEHGGTDAQVLSGMQWAIEQGVDVISMSLGGLTLGPDVPNTYTETIVDAIRLGIPVVTAIGNDGNQTTGAPGNDLFAFAVGATDYEDRVAGFSGGRTMLLEESEFIDPRFLPLTYMKPDVSAPGVAVLSSVPEGEHKVFNGTSMATPHVAGAVALLLANTQIRENFDGAERAYLVMDLISGAVERLGEAGRDHRYGYGRLDAFRSVGLARNLGYNE